MSVATGAPTRAPRTAVRSQARTTTYTWSRRLHLWTSTVSLLLVLFFSVTGLTLNHPEWTFGIQPAYLTTSEPLPSDSIKADGMDWFVFSEYLRDNLGVHGSVTDRYEDGAIAQISFRSPGYAADAFVDIPNQTFQLTTEQQGLIVAMNDLHRGKSSGSWRVVIDVVSVFLTTIAVTGLALLLFLKKLRATGMWLILGGSVVSVAAMWLTNL